MVDPLRNVSPVCEDLRAGEPMEVYCSVLCGMHLETCGLRSYRGFDDLQCHLQKIL